MRILSVRFQNLNSLRGTHEVNLENGPLASAGLFAITGPTGAGKSSILDAVTLALYGRAARYGKETAEGMMSRSEGECSAAVDFECAGGRYTAKWLLRRARGKAGAKLQPVTHELSQNGAIIEEKTQRVVKRVADLTELDYDRFLRSVLLAQGQFAAFLKADRGERADLLQRITGSQIYSQLSRLAHIISTEHARKIENETSRMEGIVFLTGSERNNLAGRLTDMAGQLTTAETKQSGLQALVTDLKRAAALDTELQKIDALAVTHVQAEEAFAPDAARLARHAETEPFADALAELNEAGRLASANTSTRAAASDRMQTAKSKATDEAGAAMACISAAQTAAAAEQQHIVVRQNLNAEALSKVRAWLAEHARDADLAGKLPHLSTLAARAGFLSAQCDSAAASLAKTQAAAATAAAKLKTARQNAEAAAAQAQLSESAAALSRATLAALLVEPWTSVELLPQEVSRLSAGIDTLTRLSGRQSSLAERGRKLTALAAEVPVLQKKAAEQESLAARAREQLESHKRIEQLLRERLSDQQIIRSLAEHRTHLQDGQPCPLCGSAEHPWSDPAALPSDDSIEAQLKKQSQEVVLAEKTLASASETFAAANKSLAELQARLHAHEEGLFSARAEMEAEWRTLAPGRECTPENLADALREWIARHSTMAALSAKALAAQEAERKAATGALRAAADAQMMLAAKEAAGLQCTAADAAAEDAQKLLATSREAHTAHLVVVAAAFAEAGESSAENPAAALERLHARERTWRERQTSLTELERQNDALQHAHSKSVDSAKTWESRRHETEAAIARAAVAPSAGPATPGEWTSTWQSLNARLTNLTASQQMLAAAADAEKHSAEILSARHAALTHSLKGSDFETIEDLRTARLESGTLQTLLARRDQLRHENVRIHTQREKNIQERNALTADIEQKVAAAGGETTDLRAWEELLIRATESVRTLHVERGALQQRMQSDDENRARHTAALEVLAVMKTAAAPWSRLSGLIGSAEGDKFSRFAQSVTLDHLTALANARLAQLCDRYRLLRSGAAADLQLQICDAWQGDSLRPMESLSGGESFLVSLALALGLSELAGRRTRIGTLFIDEGFGTLDSTALDIALSALETLRTGHSTIAVISHVEALKTRLTTQVEVVRGAGGWSTLHVRT